MLPLLAGIAVGAGAVVAVNNHKELKEKITTGAKTVKDTAVKAKDTVVEKVDCLTSKKDTKDTETIEDKDDTTK